MNIPVLIASGFIGIFVVAVFCILFGAWAEKRGKPPADHYEAQFRGDE